MLAINRPGDLWKSMYRIGRKINRVGFQFVCSFVDVMILGEILGLSRTGLGLYGEDFVSRVIDSFVSLELEMVFLDDKVQEFFPLSLPDRCRLLFLRRRHRAVSATIPWWRHHVETLSALLTLCEGNPSVTGGFPSKGTVMLTLNTSLNKWSSHLRRRDSLWRHCNAVM